MDGEKLYKVMRGTGAINIAAGVTSIVVGVSIGILMIIAGARLLANKSKILF